KRERENFLFQGSQIKSYKRTLSLWKRGWGPVILARPGLSALSLLTPVRITWMSSELNPKRKGV
uniref:Uncharacterized protein n=1 Tax=Macaca nemestrina TaxID=9545 RepID=A0A2K6DA57_MACNE